MANILVADLVKNAFACLILNHTNHCVDPLPLQAYDASKTRSYCVYAILVYMNQ